MSTQETALSKLEPKAEAQSGKLARIAAFTPTNLTEAIALSKLIAGSDLAPKDFKGKPANVLIAMQMGAEVGLAPMQSLQNIAVINGRPSLWGDAALGVVQVHPEYEWHKEGWDGQKADKVAWFQIKRKGQEAYTTRFGVADAVKAGLWGKAGPWQTYPDRMLQMRARGFGLRDKFADALRGLSIAEESMDIAPDTSDVKKKREEGTLDVGASVSDLSQSSEPNRGHGNEGMQKRDEQKKPEAKPDNVMCSDCSKINGHEEGCKHAAQDAKTSSATTKAGYMILEVAEKKKKDGTTYLILEVVAPDNTQGKLYCWHRSMYEALLLSKGKSIVCEVSAEKKDGKTFYQLEHITDLGGVPYVADKPAEKGTADEDF
jgi:hypothetical protein